ncbi:hypothetical protein, partial [Brucella abortus]|uniref:hypothetical protein n=1 Tax=Brucella abortus TaxID=235 RepID=UPI0027DACBB6
TIEIYDINVEKHECFPSYLPIDNLYPEIGKSCKISHVPPAYLSQAGLRIHVQTLTNGKFSPSIRAVKATGCHGAQKIK